MMTKDSVLHEIDTLGIRFVDLWFSDILGGVKNVTIPASQVERVIDHGTHFDGSSVDGFARVAESDMLLIPDLETFTILPWYDIEERTARMICTVHNPQGEPFIGDPRVALIKVIERARLMGYEFQTGLEVEFFLFETDANQKPILNSVHDTAGYFDISNDDAQIVRRKMIRTLDAMNIPTNSTHSEIGRGQHEIGFDYASALASADRFFTTRVTLRAVARQHGLYCTFMPRPRADLPGSGMHTHQSLHDLDTEENLFADSDNEYGLSDIARHFLAGQLHHARAMTAVLAPLVNSYKRLGTSFEAPVHVSWAHINRAALIRVPSVTSGTERHTRLELRCPDPSANPYLAMAVMLQAGLNGIKHKMQVPAPMEETLLTQDRKRLRRVETLPNSLAESLDALRQDEVILGALGPYIGDRFLEAKHQELEDYNRYVTGWELDRYLNRY